MHRKPARLTIAVATSTVVAAGAAASGAVALWPASAATRPAAVTSTARAGHVMARREDGGQPSLDSLGVQRLRLSMTDAQRAIAVAAARKAQERQRAEARAAARAAAERAAQQQAAQQQAAQQQAAQQQAAQQQAAQQQAAQQQAAQPQPAAAAPAGSPQQIAMSMLGSYGWSSSQFSCLDSLWNHESGWNVSASNPSSGAYGIPQALPGSKMASAGRTGRPTLPPRSAGAWVTSRAPTDRRAARGRMRSRRAGTDRSLLSLTNIGASASRNCCRPKTVAPQPWLGATVRPAELGGRSPVGQLCQVSRLKVRRTCSKMVRATGKPSAGAETLSA